MTAVPAGAGIGERSTGHRAEAQGIVEFAIGQQPGIGGVPRAMELKLQTAVEIKPESTITRFTRRVLHDGLIWSRLNS
jgi:hypothetical protein